MIIKLAFSMAAYVLLVSIASILAMGIVALAILLTQFLFAI